jgi:hypothetical protein
MEKDFEKDIIVSFNNCVIYMDTHEVFDKEALERSLDKLFILRLNQEHDGKIIKGLHFAREVDLPIKKAVETRCFLKTEDGEIITDSLELDIFSISEAEKITDSEDKKIQLLKFMGADTSEKREDIARGDEILMDLNKSMNEFIHSDKFKKRKEKIKDE